MAKNKIVVSANPKDVFFPFLIRWIAVKRTFEPSKLRDSRIGLEATHTPLSEPLNSSYKGLTSPPILDGNHSVADK